jgi:exonuclease III
MSAGTSILVNRIIAPQISTNGIFLEGRAQFITIHFPNNGSLTIINIYVAKSSNKKMSMSRKLNKVGFVTNHIIRGGDFNHFEKTNHRGIARERQMYKKEAATWHHMTLQYELSDTWKLDNFQKMMVKEYTFDNDRSGPNSAVFRINKFLVSQELDAWGGRIEASTLVRKLSDHSPLVLTIWGQLVAPDKTCHYFDSSPLGDEKGRVELLLA